jgi:hypothetical protein
VAAGAGAAGLSERIDAARRDLRTRRLCADALDDAPTFWPAAIEEALRDDRLARRVLDGAAPGTADEASALVNVLLWAREDRDLRLALLAAAQRRRGTARLDDAAVRPVTVAQVLDRLGDKAPAGDARARWLLAQRVTLDGATLKDLRTLCERDLGLQVTILSEAADHAGKVSVREAPVAEAFDKLLGPASLYYRVRGGALWVGRLEDLVQDKPHAE